MHIFFIVIFKFFFYYWFAFLRRSEIQVVPVFENARRLQSVASGLIFFCNTDWSILHSSSFSFYSD